MVSCKRPGCPKVYHADCLNLTKRPAGEWLCMDAITLLIQSVVQYNHFLCILCFGMLKRKRVKHLLLSQFFLNPVLLNVTHLTEKKNN